MITKIFVFMMLIDNRIFQQICSQTDQVKDVFVSHCWIVSGKAFLYRVLPGASLHRDTALGRACEQVFGDTRFFLNVSICWIFCSERLKKSGR